MIVLRPDGSEVTRLSSGAAEQLPAVLRSTAGRTVPIEALFDKAQKDPSALSQDEWGLLAAFDWQNDPKHFGDQARAGTLLERLSAAAPDAALKRRFALLALVTEAHKGLDGKSVLTPSQQASLEEVLPAILASPAEVITNREALSDAIPDLVAALPDAALRAKLGESLVAALDGVYRDQSLPLPDRLATVNADITLAKASNALVIGFNVRANPDGQGRGRPPAARGPRQGSQPRRLGRPGRHRCDGPPVGDFRRRRLAARRGG